MTHSFPTRRSSDLSSPRRADQRPIIGAASMRSTRESARSGGVAALRPRLRLEGERRESGGLQGRRPVVLGKPRLPFKPGKEKLRVGQIGPDLGQEDAALVAKSEEHTSELQSLMRISY